MEEPFDEEFPAERPVTACPECANEIDLTFCEPGSSITCTVCGAEWIVLSLDPPDIGPLE
jgi:lysine biosynthesis protein LysW